MHREQDTGAADRILGEQSYKLDTELLLTKLHPSHTLPEAETLRRKHLETRVKAVP